MQNATHALDFSALTLRDALDLAVLVEEAAKERYEDLAACVQAAGHADAARFFRLMIEIEASHEHRLRERRILLFGRRPSAMTREMIHGVEAPDVDALRAGCSEQDALWVALHAEQRAYRFFDAALPHVRDCRVRDLFAELRDDERAHHRAVELHLKRRWPDTSIEAL